MTELENLGSLEEELEKTTEKLLDTVPEEVMEIFYDNIARLASSDIMEFTLKEGDVAPDFCLPNTNNELVSSIDLRAQGPLVVIFFRGKWCPYDIDALLPMIRKYTPHFQARGATVVAISSLTVEKNQELAEEVGLTFPVLSDDHCEYAQSCNIAYEMEEIIRPLYPTVPASQGNDSWVVPLAATYVIETDGRVVYSFVDCSAMRRAEPRHVLNALPPFRIKRHLLKENLSFHLSKLEESTPDSQMQVFFKSIENLSSTGILQRAIRKGDLAPDFRLTSAEGDVYDSIQLREQRGTPLIVTFFLGEWCPFCILMLEAMQSFWPKFEAKGATLLAISPQSQQASLLSAAKSDAKFPMLLDTDGKVAKAFRIDYSMDSELREFWLSNAPGSEIPLLNATLPLTATYVIDPASNRVLYSFIGCDPSKRGEPTKILVALPLDNFQHTRKRGPFSLKLGGWLPPIMSNKNQKVEAVYNDDIL
jgi:peroxiredoxin